LYLVLLEKLFKSSSSDSVKSIQKEVGVNRVLPFISSNDLSSFSNVSVYKTFGSNFTKMTLFSLAIFVISSISFLVGFAPLITVPIVSFVYGILLKTIKPLEKLTTLFPQLFLNSPLFSVLNPLTV